MSEAPTQHDPFLPDDVSNLLVADGSRTRIHRHSVEAVHGDREDAVPDGRLDHFSTEESFVSLTVTRPARTVSRVLSNRSAPRK